MKTRKDVAELMDRVFKDCQGTREQGQKEYAHDEQNALANFERTGKDLGIPREKVLWIFLKKHTDGVLAWINGHRILSFPTATLIWSFGLFFCFNQDFLAVMVLNNRFRFILVLLNHLKDDLAVFGSLG